MIGVVVRFRVRFLRVSFRVRFRFRVRDKGWGSGQDTG